MYQQPELLLEQYDIEVKAIQKGRGAFLVSTNLGPLLLQEYRGSVERAQILGEIWKTLKELGYPAEQLYYSKEQEPVIQDEYEVSYILKDHIQGMECNPRSREEMKRAMEEIARFHQYSEACLARLPLGWKLCHGELYEIRTRNTKELIKARNYIRGKRKKNAFEELFQKRAPYYLELARENLKQLETESAEEIRPVLCHGECNHHNVVHKKEQWQVTELMCLQYNYGTKDVVNFLRKMLEKNQWDIRLGQELLASYEKVRGLTPQERKRIYLELAYPEKFWKVTNHYMNTNKAWGMERDVEKLQKVIDQEPSRVAFLESFSRG